MNSIKAKCFVYRFCPTNRCMEIVTSSRIIRMICIIFSKQNIDWFGNIRLINGNFPGFLKKILPHFNFYEFLGNVHSSVELCLELRLRLSVRAYAVYCL